MLAWLTSLKEQGSIRALDLHFARFIASEANCSTQIEQDSVLLLSLWVSNELATGNVCLNLEQLAITNLAQNQNNAPELFRLWLDKPYQLLDNLSSLNVIKKANNDLAPLIVDGCNVYLYRYWQAEVYLANRINAMLQPCAISAGFNLELNKLFGISDKKIDWQKTAAAIALTRQFSVLSGGPGTGKTTTVIKILAAILIDAKAKNRDKKIEIKLAAPTGKAAARLSESISNAIAHLEILDEIKENIPTQSQTIHRLLGAYGERVGFTYNEQNPLHLDVLIVDEASMIDLTLMTNLLKALPKTARLILLGDRDQLASVEAGSILGEICSFIESGYNQKQAQTLGILTGYDYKQYIGKNSAIGDCLCQLRHSYRFGESSGIGKLSKAINKGSWKDVERIFKENYADISFFDLTGDSYRQLIAHMADKYSEYFDLISKKAPTLEIIDSFAKQRLLCALRDGNYGVNKLNEYIYQALVKKNKIKGQVATWYEGRPIILTKNEHSLGLYNGDIGICLIDPNTKQFKVYFSTIENQVKSVLPSRLPEHESAFAMTIHKSQGSEFADTYILLPDSVSPVITRELIYTGITRAKNNLQLYAKPAILKYGLHTKTLRASGLAARLN